MSGHNPVGRRRESGRLISIQGPKGRLDSPGGSDEGLECTDTEVSPEKIS